MQPARSEAALGAPHPGLVGADMTRQDADDAGRIRLRFERDGEATRLAELFQRQPLRALFPDPARGDVPLAALVNTSGGLVAGDEHRVQATAGPGARAVLAAQAAEKVYRAGDGPAGPLSCTVDVDLRAGTDAWLEWLPQETILFQGARLARTTRVHAAPGARVLAGEMLVLGRLARGERFTSGLLREAWEIRLNGRLAWADRMELEGGFGHVLDSPSGFGGATASATLAYVGPDADALLEPLREALSEEGCRTGATLVGGVLLARWLAEDPLALRESFASAWLFLRSRAGGLPGRMPVFWNV